ncbi:MAG: tRNA lysidine(34) synthetase TilS [Pirellulales bacterium]|nr:tRNA lysidine(34) synthetase TilS [Pirellulales bacterium]
MPHDFELRFAENWPPEDWCGVTVLVAVSGGADSVALFRAMLGSKQSGTGRLRAAHFNHRLRPEAEDDEQFVRELCAKWNVPCEVGVAEVAQMASASGEGIEEAARRLRYDFLESAAGRLGARYVATAHTADDQAETILHRILRGTGVSGLAGIARARTLGHATLIRPLLEFRRADVEQYLTDIGQPYRRDASNSDLRFTRNRIRRELLPLLVREYNSQAVEAILRLGSLAGEMQAVVDRAVAELFERIVTIESRTSVRIDLSALETTDSYLFRELLMSIWRRQNWPLQAMGFDQWCLLETMARESFYLSPKRNEKRVFPGAIRAETARGEMRLRLV